MAPLQQVKLAIRPATSNHAQPSQPSELETPSSPDKETQRSAAAAQATTKTSAVHRDSSPTKNASAAAPGQRPKRRIYVQNLRFENPWEPALGIGDDQFQELMPTRRFTEAELADAEAAKALDREKKKAEIKDAMAAGRDTTSLRRELARIETPWTLYERVPRHYVDKRPRVPLQDRPTARQPYDETAKFFPRGIAMLQAAGFVGAWKAGTLWGQDGGGEQARDGQSTTPPGVQNPPSGSRESGRGQANEDAAANLIGRDATPTFYGFQPLNPRPLNVGLGWFGYDQVHNQQENGTRITRDMVQDRDWFASHEGKGEDGNRVIMDQEPIILVDEHQNNPHVVATVLDKDNISVHLANKNKSLADLLEDKARNAQSARHRASAVRGRGRRGHRGGAGRGRGRGGPPQEN